MSTIVSAIDFQDIIIALEIGLKAVPHQLI